jgi:hypothetical protein
MQVHYPIIDIQCMGGAAPIGCGVRGWQNFFQVIMAAETSVPVLKCNWYLY